MSTNSSFSDDYNEDEDVREEEEVPAWRLDPENSFSDWTIRVIQSTDENCDEKSHCDDNDEREEERNYIDNFHGSRNNHTSDPQDADVATAIPTDNHRSQENDDMTMDSPPPESVYNVHRVYLASGCRKSDYFQTLFSLQTSTTESLSRTIKLVFPESACTVFPNFLDYMYDAFPQDLIMHDYTRRAAFGDSTACKEIVALTFLADYLGVSKLTTLIKDHMSDILDHRLIHVICKEALLYKIDWIIDDCIHIAAKSPRDLFPPTTTDDTGGNISSGSTSGVPSIHSIVHKQKSDRSLMSASRTFPPALQIMEMLPLDKQNELLKLSLSNTLRELGRFKRVPSQWKRNIDDLYATHMPTLMARKDRPSEDNYQLPKQGCGLPFPKHKICPVFYFDREPTAPAASSPPLAPSPHQQRTDELLLIQMRDLIARQSSSEQSANNSSHNSRCRYEFAES